ncbi:MAG: four helix bundle protein [Candidatus Omnitrophota bacterium]
MIEQNEFSFEKLGVYKKAINFTNSIFNICNNFPNKVQYSLGDQLRRASLSIVNNLAEGSDKRFPKDKKKFYEYALDSARECIPMLTICVFQGLIDRNIEGKLREEGIVICKMLRKLILSVH